MSLLVVGSIGYDNVETPFGKVDNALGGSAVFFTAASSHFTGSRIVGVVGEDYDMSKLEFLTKRGTDLAGIDIKTGKTFRWGGKYHNNMNDRDTIFTDLNVLADFKPLIPEQYKNSEYLFLANIHPSLQLDVIKQVNKPKFTALDTMNFWIDSFKDQVVDVFKYVDGIIINDSEVMDLAGEGNIIKAAEFVASLGPKIVIIKKGEHGAVLFYNGDFYVLPALLLDTVVDPTGAGDSFAGGFMGYLAREDKIDLDTIKTAMLYGTCTAAFCCEKFGPEGLSVIDINTINKRVNQLKEQISF